MPRITMAGRVERIDELRASMRPGRNAPDNDSSPIYLHSTAALQ